MEPDQILVVVNGQIDQSVKVGQYYCQRRGVPKDHILSIALGPRPSDTISRQDYDRVLARTVRQFILSLEEPQQIRALVTCWGVPFRVQGRGPIPGMERTAEQIRAHIEHLLDRENDAHKIRLLQMELDRLTGNQTGASVDSELSMVLFGDYELYRWQPNLFKDTDPNAAFRVIMVSRVDGPSPKIAMSLVDKAIKAEQQGLNGYICIDSRGIKDRSEIGRYDQSLRDLAAWIKTYTNLPLRHDDSPDLFPPGSCQQTAIYCGWYSLKNYVDAFDFVDGAIGFHIASFEAANLRDSQSRQWCPAMLSDGIAATLGPVDEPYLSGFPMPLEFFKALFEGTCLAEAYYQTNPFNSWQMVLIGDPLYRPFARRH